MLKVIGRDERQVIFNGNVALGYVENETLFGIDRDGFAVEICQIDNNNQIVTRFREWQTKQ